MSAPTQTPLIANEWRAIKAGQRLSESIKWPQEAFNIKPENIGWFVKKDDKDATMRPAVIDSKGRLFLIQPGEQRIVFKAKARELIASGVLSTGRIPMEDGVPAIPKELAEATLNEYRRFCEQRKAAAASAAPTSPQQPPVTDRQPASTEATTPHKRKLSESAAVAVTDEPEPKRTKTDSKPAEQKPVFAGVSDPTPSMASDHHAPTAVNTEPPAPAVASPPPQASSSSVPTKCPSYLPSFTPIFNILYSHMKDPERPIAMASPLAFPSRDQFFDNLEAPPEVYVCTCLALSLVNKAKMGHPTPPPQHFSGQGIPRYSVWFERNKAYHRKMVPVPMDPFPEDLAPVPCDSYLAAACDAMVTEADALWFPFAGCASWSDVVNEAYKVANGEDESTPVSLSREQVISALESFIDHYLSPKVL